MEYIDQLISEFENNANSKIAVAQKAYMKNRFEFYGIPAPLRKELQKPFLVKKYLPSKEDLTPIVKSLWLRPQRELQYFSQELVFKFKNEFEAADIDLFEWMITRKSWWDTVDFLAAKCVGEEFKKYPELREPYVTKWVASGNIWLQRTAILFQLNYKEEVDKALLTYVIRSSLGSKEFFINKAIGWMLRNYSRVNPEWVLDFVEKTSLSNLSQREALRLILKKDYL